MPSKRTAAVRSETSQAAVPTSKKSKIEPADPPPDPIPNGLEAAKSEIVKRVQITPKVPCRHRSDIHYKVQAPKGDPEAALRGFNIYWMHEEMERDAQVNAAFASLRQTLEEGKPAPRIDSPYVKDDMWPHDDWEMFDELDQLDFKYWELNRKMEFYDPNSKDHDGKCGGIIDDIRELQGKLKAFDMPQHASLEPIIVKMTSRCRRIKMWFAGNGYMRMQCETGSKADFRNGCTTTVVWSCLQRTKERKERKIRELPAKQAKHEAEVEARQAKKRQEEQEKQAKELEEKKKRRETLRRKHENGEINSSESEESTAEEEEEDDNDEEEELLESDHSSAPSDSPPSSIGEMDWTETEEEEENGN